MPEGSGSDAGEQTKIRGDRLSRLDVDRVPENFGISPPDSSIKVDRMKMRKCQQTDMGQSCSQYDTSRGQNYGQKSIADFLL